MKVVESCSHISTKFKFAVYHVRILDTSIHVLRVCIDVFHYVCGTLNHIFGVLASGCTHTHLNCKLGYVRLLFMCMSICHTIFEGTRFRERISAEVCLLWLLIFFHVKVVDLLCS